ncbi:hypothetical protein Vadar_022374 [Vaccinium darrowii]|uniref:Uncharacterized protein n=1 Tax=Vaccinium darrowii TaxID=229202 RepID=A0ACB7YGG1_9ERIC|nr:hypothetical protein Vadar_022374 [Vaccinium darrowii]
MASVVLLVLLVIFLTLFIKAAYEIASCYFLTPRRIKKIMENQGVSGPKPRFLTGNIMDMACLVSKHTSKDMDLISHDIVGRLLPHFLTWSQAYGKRFIYWHGMEPRMCLTETELIKELLSRYSKKAGKSWLQQEGSKHFIGRGLLMANGDDWHHQRHIVAPAFMGDKLKGYAGSMVDCTSQMLQSLHDAVELGQTEFEIGEYMSRLTAHIISRTEFDCSYEKGQQIFYLLTLLQNRCAQSSRHLCFPGSRVINESLRLYPPASVLPRMAFEDFKLGDLHIPKGLSIWIPVLAIHHSEELWGKDVNEFNPNRFATKSFSPGRFIPFAAGPRNCVGQSFAMMEVKIILAMLITRFKFAISENYRHAPVIVLTVKPKYGVQILLTPLSS